VTRVFVSRAEAANQRLVQSLSLIIPETNKSSRKAASFRMDFGRNEAEFPQGKCCGTSWSEFLNGHALAGNVGMEFQAPA
jgi:hypothetical protein